MCGIGIYEENKRGRLSGRSNRHRIISVRIQRGVQIDDSRPGGSVDDYSVDAVDERVD